MLFVALFLAVFAMLVLQKTIHVVPENSAYVVERLGRYHATLRAGMHVLVPTIDRVAFRYSLLPQAQDLMDVCITSDNISVTVTSRYQWRVVDPRRFAYTTADGNAFIANLVRTHQRKWIGARQLQAARDTTRELEEDLVRSTREPAMEGGAEITSVTIFAIASKNE